MARPRVFVSSTYYDLKHIRYSLDNFIQQLGYDSILSEKGDIAYSFDIPLDQSCYKEVETVDVFVLIIGGRYGSEISGNSTDTTKNKKFNEKYESITKTEYEKAVEKDIPIYIMIESNVYSEYQTYSKNRDNQKVKYAHVDSVNIFIFMDEILSKARNNPIKTFEKFDEIEIWLREQWAGLFRELLNRRSQQNQIRTLATEISDLQEINKTLKTYLEEVLTTVKPSSNTLIESEKKRLSDVSVRKALEENHWFNYIVNHETDLDKFIDQMYNSNSYQEYVQLIKNKSSKNDIERTLSRFKSAQNDLNKARALLNLSLFEDFPEAVI